MGEVAEEDDEAGGLVPLEPPERRLVRPPLVAGWSVVLDAGGRALDRVVLAAAERAVVVVAAAGAVALDLTEPGVALVELGVGAGVPLALLESPAPPEAADLPVDRVVGGAMAGRGGAGTGGEISAAAALGRAAAGASASHRVPRNR